MARNVSDTRFGRALMAGIPVALILIGAELAAGDWSIERGERGLVLSWSSDASDQQPLGKSTMRLASCSGPDCHRWTVAVALPDHGLGEQIAMAASQLGGWMSGDCTERERPVAML